MRLLFTNSYAA